MPAETEKAIIKTGLKIAKIIVTVTVLKKPKVAKAEIPGRSISIVDISLEKRASMRPTGFESKNKILDLATLLIIES